MTTLNLSLVHQYIVGRTRSSRQARNYIGTYCITYTIYIHMNVVIRLPLFLYSNIKGRLAYQCIGTYIQESLLGSIYTGFEHITRDRVDEMYNISSLLLKLA